MGSDIKEKAGQAYSKGKFDKAAELYQAYCAEEPRDHQSRVRLGDAWSRAGKVPQAISAYRLAAEGFAKEGFLPRAIASAKLILEIDPQHAEVQQMIANLYARKRAPPPAASPPASPGPTPEELASPSKRHAIVSPLELETTAGSVSPAADEQSNEPGEAPEEEIIDLVTVVSPKAVKPPVEEKIEEIIELQSVVQLSVSGSAPEEEVIDEPFDLTPAAQSARFDELEMDMESAAAALWAGPEKPPIEAASSDSLLEAVERAAEMGAQGAWLETVDVESEGETRRGLPEIPLFSDLDRDAFLALFHRSPLRRAGPGERIITQGEHGDAFYVICSGSVRVLREENGQSRVVAEIGEGGFFGEMALLSGSPRAASVEAAHEDTQLLEMSAAVLAEVARSYPGVAKALKRFCRQRMLANVIETSALFNVFDRKERKALAERFLASEAPGGEVLIEEGKDSDGLYVILSGEVEVRRNGAPIALLREGELFGEMSLLTKSPAQASVKARRKTALLRLPRADFDALILSHPQVLVHISELTDARRTALD